MDKEKTENDYLNEIESAKRDLEHAYKFTIVASIVVVCIIGLAALLLP